MKKFHKGTKFYEADSIVTVILLFTVVMCAFFFNVKIKKNTSKARRHTEKQVKKAERKKDRMHEQQLSEENLEYQRKMNDPLWRYYDYENDEVKVLPGRYGIDDPPGRQHMD